MAYIMDRGGNMWDSDTGGLVRAGHTPMAPPYMPMPVVTYPPTPAAYEDASKIEAIKEIRTLVSQTKFREPVGAVDGVFEPEVHGMAFIDIPRTYLGLSEAKALIERMEAHGFKLVKVIK